MKARMAIFKASVKLHTLMRTEELADYPYAYPFDDLVKYIAEQEGISDEELDNIGMEATELAFEICHILEVQKRNAE